MKPVYNGGLPPMITVEQYEYNTGDVIYTDPVRDLDRPNGWR